MHNVLVEGNEEDREKDVDGTEKQDAERGVEGGEGRGGSEVVGVGGREVRWW